MNSKEYVNPVKQTDIVSYNTRPNV